MPIYAYQCESCGHARDVLQKISDSPLTKCPACGAERFKKQLTAAGFQLKGSGWYATDFRQSSAAPAAKTEGGAAAATPAPASAEAGSTDSSAASSSAATASSSPCGGACSCH